MMKSTRGTWCALVCMALLFGAGSAMAQNHYVPGDSGGVPAYPTIAAAILAAAPGDTIWLDNIASLPGGIYPEEVLVSVDNLTIDGSMAATQPIIDGTPALFGMCVAVGAALPGVPVPLTQFTMNNVTLTNAPGGAGMAVIVAMAVNLNNCLITGNVADGIVVVDQLAPLGGDVTLSLTNTLSDANGGQGIACMPHAVAGPVTDSVIVNLDASSASGNGGAGVYYHPSGINSAVTAINMSLIDANGWGGVRVGQAGAEYTASALNISATGSSISGNTGEGIVTLGGGSDFDITLDGTLMGSNTGTAIDFLLGTGPEADIDVTLQNSSTIDRGGAAVIGIGCQTDAPTFNVTVNDSAINNGRRAIYPTAAFTGTFTVNGLNPTLNGDQNNAIHTDGGSSMSTVINLTNVTADFTYAGPAYGDRLIAHNGVNLDLDINGGTVSNYDKHAINIGGTGTTIDVDVVNLNMLGAGGGGVMGVWYHPAALPTTSTIDLTGCTVTGHIGDGILIQTANGRADLALANCTIDGNTGWGLNQEGGGTLTATGATTFSGNTAGGLAGSWFNGLTATLTGTTISNNTGTGISQGNAAIDNDLTLVGCTLSGNGGHTIENYGTGDVNISGGTVINHTGSGWGLAAGSGTHTIAVDGTSVFNGGSGFRISGGGTVNLNGANITANPGESMLCDNAASATLNIDTGGGDINSIDSFALRVVGGVASQVNVLMGGGTIQGGHATVATYPSVWSQGGGSLDIDLEGGSILTNHGRAALVSDPGAFDLSIANGTLTSTILTGTILHQSATGTLTATNLTVNGGLTVANGNSAISNVLLLTGGIPNAGMQITSPGTHNIALAAGSTVTGVNQGLWLRGSGTIDLNGANITGNEGLLADGGAAANPAMTVNMNGGNITGLANRAVRKVTGDGILNLNMAGGDITNSTVDPCVWLQSPGVFNLDMGGGTASGPTTTGATLLVSNGADFVMNVFLDGGTLDKATDGGSAVASAGTTTITGPGLIQGGTWSVQNQVAGDLILDNLSVDGTGAGSAVYQQIVTTGDLTITDCDITVSAGGGQGIEIAAVGDPGWDHTGTLTVTDTVISGVPGSGIFGYSSGVWNLTRLTSTGNGGGVYVAVNAGNVVTPAITMVDCAIDDNGTYNDGGTPLDFSDDTWAGSGLTVLGTPATVNITGGSFSGNPVWQINIPTPSGTPAISGATISSGGIPGAVPTNIGNATFTNCDFDDFNFVGVPSPMSADNGRVVNGSAVLDGCSFANIRGHWGATPDHSSTLVAVGTGQTVTITNCSINNGTLLDGMLLSNQNGTLNLENMTWGDVDSLFTIRNGYHITTADSTVNATDSTIWGQCFVNTHDGAVGNTVYNIDRCEFPQAFFWTAPWPAQTDANGLQVNALNSIFTWDAVHGQIFWQDSPLRAGMTNSLQLTHCTLNGPAASALIVAGQPSDIDLNYCILDTETAAKAAGEAIWGGPNTIDGADNVIYGTIPTGTDNTTGTINADPVLDATGRLTLASGAAIDAAGASAEVDDVDGLGNRPFDGDGSGTDEADIGAYEFGTLAAPAPPTALSAAPQSDSEIALFWTDNSVETYFEIDRMEEGGSWALLDGAVPADSESYNDTTVAADTTYTYRVRACNVSHCSGNSNEASATTPTEGGFFLAVVGPTLIEATVEDEVSMEVSASGNIGAVTYQWYFDDGAKAANPIAGATSAIYAIASVVIDDSGEYYCVGMDSVSTTAQSATITLDVSAALPVAGGLGLGILAGLAALSGAAVLRRKQR